MYRSEPLLQWLSLILLVFLVPHLLGFTVHQQSEARPLNPNMEVEGRKKQSLSSSTFEAVLVKEQYVANKGQIPAGGPPVLYSPPSHIGKHVMSAAPRVHGGEYVSLNKGPVPPSAPDPIRHGP
ncbi:hypothetical protein SO802_013801 [Lithocarpus litseifolius]|uniref:Uncharacterized protein n=1 Tax=Lithocarpus litseifolius TaxID=425828 RepID=A0AAW2D6M2_9ROSI